MVLFWNISKFPYAYVENSKAERGNLAVLPYAHRESLSQGEESQDHVLYSSRPNIPPGESLWREPGWSFLVGKQNDVVPLYFIGCIEGDQLMVSWLDWEGLAGMWLSLTLWPARTNAMLNYTDIQDYMFVVLLLFYKALKKLIFLPFVIKGTFVTLLDLVTSWLYSILTLWQAYSLRMTLFIHFKICTDKIILYSSHSGESRHHKLAHIICFELLHEHIFVHTWVLYSTVCAIF